MSKFPDADSSVRVACSGSAPSALDEQKLPKNANLIETLVLLNDFICIFAI